MTAYVVEVLRTERIYFETAATDSEDAERRYLMDETGSGAVETEPEIVSVTLAEAREGN